MHNPDGKRKSWVCEHCGNTYQKSTGLKQHMVSAHSDVRDFRCPHCSKGFTTQQRLDQHLRIHSGAKPFKCKMCEYRAVRRDNVHLHVRKVHKVSAAVYLYCFSSSIIGTTTICISILIVVTTLKVSQHQHLLVLLERTRYLHHKLGSDDNLETNS